MGRLVLDQHYSFHWTPGEGARLAQPDGQAIHCPGEDYIPFLVDPHSGDEGSTDSDSSTEGAVAGFARTSPEQRQAILEHFEEHKVEYVQAAQAARKSRGKKRHRRKKVIAEEQVEEEEEEFFQGLVLQGMKEGEHLRYEDNFKHGKTASTEVEKAGGTWYAQEHRFPRTTLWAPMRVGEKSHFTGKRLTEINRVSEEEIKKALREANKETEEKAEKEAPMNEAPISVPAPKSKAHDKLRFHHPESDPDPNAVPWAHYINHYPVNHKCTGCEEGKVTRTPAYRHEEEEMITVEEDLDNLVGDLVENIADDAEGNGHLFTALDADSKYPKVRGIPDKEAEMSRASYMIMYPGTRWDVPVWCPRSFGRDNAGLFKPDFKVHPSKSGTDQFHSLPGRSKTNADIERFNLELEHGVAVPMRTAGAPRAAADSCGVSLGFECCPFAVCSS